MTPRAALAFGLVTAALATMASAAPAAQAVPDISGVWLGRFTPRLAPDPPLLPAAAAIVQTRKPEDDPMGVCVPPGVPRVMSTAFPIEILQTPGRVTILLEYDHFVRRVYTDERPHPAELEPTWMGDSIGRWEGDTLVVETVGIDERTWLDERGLPHSDALKVTERFRKSPDGKSLSHEITLDDPKMYARPWTSSKTYIAKPDMRIMEFVCQKH